MRRPFIPLCLSLSFSLAGCLANTAISVDDQTQVQLVCDVDDDCPEAFACKALAGQGRCIPSSVLAKDPLLIEDELTLEADVVSPQAPHDKIVVTFSFNEPPATFAVTMDDGVFDCAPDDAAADSFRCFLTVGDAVLEGRRVVRLFAHDAAFNVVERTVSVDVDRSGPRVVDFDVERIEAPGVALVAVTSATVGSSLRLRIGFDEDLDEDAPAIVLVPGGEPCEVLDDDEDDEITCAVVLNDTPGPRSLSFSAVDRLDNRSDDLHVPIDVEIDLVPPAAPDVDLEGGIVYRRAPWGRDADPTARFDVVATAAAFEAGTTLVVFADVDGAQPLGIGGVDPAAPINLDRIDRAVVYVAAVDGAGQRSAVRAVSQQQWTATLGGKVGTRRFENPHQVFSVPDFTAALLGPLDAEIADARPLSPGNVDSAFVAVTERWREREVLPAPPDRSEACLAFDSARGRALLFGGGGAGTFGDTWTFGDDGWRQEAPVAAPPPRRRAGCAYDPLRDRVVLVGGEELAGASDQIWEWDGRTWALAQAKLPAPALEVTAAFDLSRAGVVVVAGDASFVIDDDLTALTGSPAGVVGGDLVAGADGLVFHGGSTGVAQTWLLDDTGWAQLAPTTVPPLSTSQLLYRDVDGAITLLTDDGAADLRFVFSGGQWGSATAIAAGGRVNAASTTLDDAVLVFGGNPGVVDRTTLIAGERLSPGTPPPTSSPSVGQLRQAAFDPGDVDDPASLLVSDGDSIFALTGAGMANLRDAPDFGLLVDGTDVERARLIANNGLVFGFDLDPLTPREFASELIATDAAIGSIAGGRAVRRGDDVLLVRADGAAFELRDDVWTTVAALPVLPVNGFALAGLGSQAVLFPDAEGDTWTFDGVDWTEHVFAAGAAPPNRTSTAMVTDLDAGTAFLFGGAPNFSDAWEWDGAAWSEVDVVGPDARFSVALGFDRQRHRTLAIGGVLSDDEIWEWDSAAASTPALRFAVSVGAAQLGDTAILTDVAVDVDDASFLLWTAGAWVPAGAPLSQLLSGDEPTLHIAVPMDGRSGSVDSFQTTMTFRSRE